MEYERRCSEIIRQKYPGKAQLDSYYLAEKKTMQRYIYLNSVDTRQIHANPWGQKLKKGIYIAMIKTKKNTKMNHKSPYMSIGQCSHVNYVEPDSEC